MSRAEIENKILRSLVKGWDIADETEAFDDQLLADAYGEEFSQEIKKENQADDDAYAFSRLSKAAQEKQLLAEELNEIQKERKQREYNKLSGREKFQKGLTDAFGEGHDDHRQAFWNARETQDLDIEAPKIQRILGINPTFTRARDLISEAKFLPRGLREAAGSNPADRKAREDAGLGLSPNGYGRAGQLLGTLGSDINQDRLRSFWWLMNAPQAVTNVSQEYMMSHMAPDLYSSDKILGKDGKELLLEKENYSELMDRDLISLSKEGNPVMMNGVRQVTASGQENAGKQALTKRRYKPGMVDALQLPSALAINAGVGLLNPLGGSNGYAAVFESEDDPTRTSNIVGEVAAKYILGRTGKMLNWDEFKEVRPDVSKDEYMRYKAFKYDKEADFNPLDGDFTIPTGVLKGNSDGIHGPEIQFLGRSMPLLTTLLPVAAAGIGTSLGASWQPEKFNDWTRDKKEIRQIRDDRIKKIQGQQLDAEDYDRKIREVNQDVKQAKADIWRKKGKKYRNEYNSINRVRNGIVSGLGAYAGGLGAGLLLENERRRRNQNENESQQSQL